MIQNKQRTILAIDPGSSKCGLAVAERKESGKISLLWRMVSPMEELAQNILNALSTTQINLFVIGSGTGSRKIVELVRENFSEINILLVDEKKTSQQAKERYWEHHKRRGWRMLLPASMQVPPVPIDDFVALILAERILNLD